MFCDFILNGQGHGDVGEALAGLRYDPGLMRPYIDESGIKCVTVNTGRRRRDEKTGRYVPVYEKVPIRQLMAQDVYSPVFNATALRKDEWVHLDNRVIMAARKRLRAWSDLMAASPYGGFDGMSSTVLEYETVTDPGEALVDMDGLADGRNDSPKFQLEGLPLPITHSGFYMSSRKLAISRKGNTPLNTVMAEAAGRRVAETVEKTLIGTVTGMTFGNASLYGRTPTVYGYTNFPARITKSNMTAPTGSNGTTVLGDWLALRDLLYAAGFYGPFMVYTSNDWDKYLDNLFSTTEPSAGTLRSRLKQIDGIQDIRRLDYLTNAYTVLMVQMTSEVAEAVNGMDIITIQWESQGGMRLNFKVMAIWVPKLTADVNGNCGIAHGTTG